VDIQLGVARLRGRIESYLQHVVPEKFFFIERFLCVLLLAVE
jgi:hypothetical protein